MQANNFISITLFIIGIPVTWYITRFYYIKAKKKHSLQIFLKYSTSFFENIESKIKNKLTFDGEPVIELVKLKFIIANTGNVVLSEMKYPLKFEYPEDVDLLDVYIIDEFNRNISFKFDENESLVNFSFEILNPGEYFECEILLKTTPYSEEKYVSILKDKKNYKFTLSKEYFPSTLPIQDYSAHNSSESLKEILLVMIAALFSSLIYSTVIYRYGLKLPNYDIFSFSSSFFEQFNFDKFLILFSWILLCMSIVGIIIISIIAIVNKYTNRNQFYIKK